MNKLEMQSITKFFPGVKALNNVDFLVDSGEIHALIGANGAGKSTLMKVLSGAISGYEGKIFINNKPVQITNPIQAKSSGIVTVYQEVDIALVPHLTVAENILMDSIANKEQPLFIDWKKIKETAEREIKSLDLYIDVKAQVSDLTLSQKQMVLIIRAVSQKAKILILDEPTAPLSIGETKKLFKIIDKLKSSGMSVIFISHRLDEVFKISEKITVLKDGQYVGTYLTKNTNINEIVEKMLGKKLEKTYPKHVGKIGETALLVRDLSGTGGIHNVNITIKRGEIVGLCGLVGGGKTELCKLIFGEGTITNGDILLFDEKIKIHTSSEAVKNGFAFVPEERRKEGVLVQESIETNITLSTLSDYCYGMFLNKKKIKKVSHKMIKQANIKTPNEKQIVANLSGGNQQKVVIGKWLLSDAEIFIFDEPTKGVDIGSKSEIYKLIGDIVRKNKSVLYASCEFSEILGLTDRTYVMYKGTIKKELITKKTTEEELLFYSTGGHSK